jgi:hypothetical protein
LIFVGIEINQNTVAAQAAAYQAIGVAVSDSWLGIADDPRRSELFHVEQFDAAKVREWTAADWAQVYSIWVGWLRLDETLKLQIEEGLLPADAASRLGFPSEQTAFLSPAQACLWPMIRVGVDAKTRAGLDAADAPVDCSELNVPSSLWAESGNYGAR